jgi:hypothetical protein
VGTGWGIHPRSPQRHFSTKEAAGIYTVRHDLEHYLPGSQLPPIPQQEIQKNLDHFDEARDQYMYMGKWEDPFPGRR